MRNFERMATDAEQTVATWSRRSDGRHDAATKSARAEARDFALYLYKGEHVHKQKDGYILPLAYALGMVENGAIELSEEMTFAMLLEYHRLADSNASSHNANMRYGISKHSKCALKSADMSLDCGRIEDASADNRPNTVEEQEQIRQFGDRFKRSMLPWGMDPAKVAEAKDSARVYFQRQGYCRFCIDSLMEGIEG